MLKRNLLISAMVASVMSVHSGLVLSQESPAKADGDSSFSIPSSLAQADFQPWPADPRETKLFPSPQSWSDQSIYSVMIDRFENGNKENDCENLNDIVGQSPDIFHGCTPWGTFHYHGGDLEGLISRLDYIKGLGVTSILVTPVSKSYGQYHGYSPWNFLDVDPNFGDFSIFRKFVYEAHKRGLYVLLDMVVNHTAPVWTYQHKIPMEPPFNCRVFDESSRLVVGDWPGNKLVPDELNDLDMFTRCGRIMDFEIPFQAENGDFLTYRDLASWKPPVAQTMTGIVSWWIAKTDIDGIRLDAIKHVDRRFLDKYLQSVKKFAASVGKNNFYIVGEAVATDYNYLKTFLGKNFNVDPLLPPTGQYLGMDGVYDTAAYYNAIGSLKYQGASLGPIRDLAMADMRTNGSFGAHARLNLRYLDLLDTRRFLDYFPEAPQTLPIGLTWIFTAPGIPLVTYGTEQNIYEVKKITDPLTGETTNVDWLDPGLGTRADMITGGIFRHQFNANQDLFRPDFKTYKLIQKLNSLRQRFSALRRGQYIPRIFDENGTGVYVFSRIFGGEEIIVAINNSTNAQVRTFSGPTVPYARNWQDALEENYRLTSTIELDTETFTIEMPPLSARVLHVLSEAKQ